MCFHFALCSEPIIHEPHQNHNPETTTPPKITAHNPTQNHSPQPHSTLRTCTQRHERHWRQLPVQPPPRRHAPLEAVQCPQHPSSRAVPPHHKHPQARHIGKARERVVWWVGWQLHDLQWVEFAEEVAFKQGAKLGAAAGVEEDQERAAAHWQRACRGYMSVWGDVQGGHTGGTTSGKENREKQEQEKQGEEGEARRSKDKKNKKNKEQDNQSLMVVLHNWMYNISI